MMLLGISYYRIFEMSRRGFDFLFTRRVLGQSLRYPLSISEQQRDDVCCDWKEGVGGHFMIE